jgi:hypothetical protein
VPTVLDGARFASKREARRYRELQLLATAGHIGGIELQPAYSVEVAGRHVCTYLADFRYVDLVSGELVVEDAKGLKTPVYRLKKKLVEALYPIVIREV